MANQQPSTLVNTKPLLFEALEEQYQSAIMLAYSGWLFNRIAKELNVKAQTVRKWFMDGGICQPAYDELRAVRTKKNKRKVKKIDETIQAYLPDAVETLHNSILAGNWKAAESLMHIGGHMPLQRIKQEVTNTNNDEIAKSTKELTEYVRQSILARRKRGA